MFADPPHSVLSDALSPAGAVVAATIAAIAAIWASIRSHQNASDIEEYKSAICRDLARLNSKLAHGQIISSTQWDAEFGAYKALWKSIVPVRTLARKIVKREGELSFIGLAPGEISEDVKIENIKNLLQKYAQKSAECVAAINEHAPFYPADIRNKANEAHALAHQIFATNIALVVARQKGLSFSLDAETARHKDLDALMDGTDELEEMIRKRMSDVQVFNPMVTQP